MASPLGKIGNSETDSGIPYDGKVYVLLGAVYADGTQIQSRLSYKSSGEAALVRRDCKDITPILLAPSEVQTDLQNPNQLRYQNQVYIASSVNAVGVGYGTLPEINKPGRSDKLWDQKESIP